MCFSRPSRPQRKSRCHHERRNSPSVIDCRPTPSCFLMTRSISRSSTALSSVVEISPLARRSRACFSVAGFLCHFHDHLELRPLLVLGQDIAFLGRGEAALRRQAKLLEWNEFRRLLDAAPDVVLRLQPSAFRSDQAEHNGLVLRHQAQRLEATSALGVVFHEVAVHVDRIEQRFRYRLVAAGSDERRLKIATAQMHRDRHVRRDVGDRGVDHASIDCRQLFRIVAAIRHLRAQFRIA